MRLFCIIFVLLSVFEISLQRSTPEDDHYVAAVVEYIVNRNEEASIANYEGLIKEAADNNADIVIFPELTLTNSSTSVTIPIHSILKEYPVPALYSEMYDHQLVAMSAAARQNAIYLVINVQESLNCSRSQLGEECPENKQYYFNTNVVFDRTGAVIDRYRKINLFGEASRTPALHPDLGIFTTDFGVTFGHFICFDLMFQVPAIQVVQKNNIKDVIFPTMWFSEMPYLTAVEIQEAYAYTLDINFLASGANNVNVGSAGSGIYSGKAGALVSTMPGVPTTRLLVAKVPKVPGMVTENYPGPIYDNPTDHDSLVLIQDPSLAAHVTRPLVQGYQEFTLVDKDVSCSFRVRLSHRSNTSVQYRALVQDGTHTYAKREIGIASCLVVACKTHEASTCPYRFNSLEESIIEELEIEMKTYAPQYNKTLSCDNIQYFPVSFRYNKFPLSSKNYTYTTKLEQNECCTCNSDKEKVLSVFQTSILNANMNEIIKFKIEAPQSELVAFGIWGRVYDRDIHPDHSVTDEDVQGFINLMDRIYRANE